MGSYDAKLGSQINELLTKFGVETPMLNLTEIPEMQRSKIEAHFKGIMQILGLDPADDSLENTPRRVAKMYVDELFWGLNPDHFPKCTAIENKMGYDEMIVEKNISVTSICEHHLVPIVGRAHVAYIPDKTVIGLSKMNRVVEYFSRRPQVQERLTEQVYYSLAYILGTENVAVVIDAEHFCVKIRGIEDINSSTVTSKLGGVFKSKPEVRAEYMQIIKG